MEIKSFPRQVSERLYKTQCFVQNIIALKTSQGQRGKEKNKEKKLTTFQINFQHEGENTCHPPPPPWHPFPWAPKLPGSALSFPCFGPVM